MDRRSWPWKKKSSSEKADKAAAAAAAAADAGAATLASTGSQGDQVYTLSINLGSTLFIVHKSYLLSSQLSDLLILTLVYE